jgi:hypothetical protein
MPNLEDLEEGFNAGMALYDDAFDKIEAAANAIQKAHLSINILTPGFTFHSPSDAHEVSDFLKAVKLPEKGTYLRVARKLSTLQMWHYVVDKCGLQQLMDAQAKKELDEQLRYVPDRPRNSREVITGEEAEKGAPPFTAANVRATLSRFSMDAQMIWRRGIANAFSNLDRRFRSHDGFKVGKKTKGGTTGGRVILTHFCDYHGSVPYSGTIVDTFRDIERTFHILDGRDPRHARSDMIQAIRNDRSGYRPQQSCTENEYLRVRVFQNGHAHLWFLRDDLVELVNKELAAYYGEVIGDSNTQEADIFESRALTPTKAFGFYPTPPRLSEKIAEKIPYREGVQRILEPSAGTGNLAFAAMKVPDYHREKGCRRIFDAIEIQPALATALRESGRFNKVTTADFLKIDPEPIYDGVLANPPFDDERDVSHVVHALKFLKPDGWLLAIMSAGTEFRETRKAAAFRKLLAERKGWMIDLPAGSFADVGTYVNTVLVGIGKGWGNYPPHCL